MIKIIENNLVVDLDKLVPNEFNPKDITEDNERFRKTIDQLKKSIKVHGQIQPVKVREIKKGYEIIDGFHTWIAMKELGEKKIEIKNLGKISYEKAVGICLSVENIKNPIDEIEEASLIKSLNEVQGIKLEEIAELTPFSVEEIETKIELINFDWNNFKQSQEDEEEIEMNTKLVVNFDTEDQKKSFLNYMKSKRKEKEVSEGTFLINLIK